MRLIENWLNNLDASGIAEAILMNVSKVYDCVPRIFLIAKFEVYGFDHNSLCLLCTYFDSLHQRVKIGSLRST